MKTIIKIDWPEKIPISADEIQQALSVYFHHPEITVSEVSKQEIINERYLLSTIDRIHNALCPDKSGTWQMRAEQAVAAAENIKSANIRLTDLCEDLWEIIKNLEHLGFCKIAESHRPNLEQRLEQEGITNKS